ncbi:MAG: hypothetical protein RR643_04915 [Anaerorhabdus sp.]|uniref:hypothetical protein n=1 Tax=Anaerorhabdus sp. TaxID=1872524 RepID=UPI002FCB85FA
MLKPIRYAKLDTYDYDLLMAGGSVYSIAIPVTSDTDVDITDISSEITANDGFIYVEDHYLTFIQTEINVVAGNYFMIILVEEI